MKINTKTKSNKLWYSLGAIALLIIAGASVYFFMSKNSLDTQTDINLAPATTEQKEDAARTKDQFINDSQSKEDNPSVANDARVIVTGAEQDSEGSLRIGAIVQRTSGDGQCTATLTMGSTTLTRATPTMQQSGFLSCLDIVFTKSELMSGTWQLTVAYKDATTSGTSQSQEVNIK